MKRQWWIDDSENLARISEGHKLRDERGSGKRGTPDNLQGRISSRHIQYTTAINVSSSSVTGLPRLTHIFLCVLTYEIKYNPQLEDKMCQVMRIISLLFHILFHSNYSFLLLPLSRYKKGYGDRRSRCKYQFGAILFTQCIILTLHLLFTHLTTSQIK